MNPSRSAVSGRSSVRRLFIVYVVVSLVPVLALGAFLIRLLDNQDRARGLAVGRAKAALIAATSISPALTGLDLRQGLNPQARAAIETALGNANVEEVLRLRIRQLDGTIVYSSDQSVAPADEDATEAAEGHTVSTLTRLNADISTDDAAAGPPVVEVYQPLQSATDERIGVLEIYLPYQPIAADIASGRRTIIGVLTGGLILLWLCLLGVSFSVTRRLRRQFALNAYLASHDTLTGMANRAEFAEGSVASRVASTDRALAVAVIDLDRFKEVNDALGHEVGDQLLVRLADRLRLHVREHDIVARLGGDEFGVVLFGVTSPAHAIEVLTRLREVLGQPLQIDGVPLAVEASIGFAIAPDDGAEMGILLQRADVAMYVAKRQHLGVVRYRPEHDQHDSANLTLVAELGAAIAANQLVLHYQPKGDIRSGEVTAVEALVRWQHPERGLLYPDTFVPLAEQTELIEALTHWVLRTATAYISEFDPSGVLNVAVNISARSLVRVDFADDVLTALSDNGADPRRLILEITETALLADPPRAAATLTCLYDAGVRISVDDFGAGQTSLGYLAMLPIKELKIDKAFVFSMLSDTRNAAIVRSVIELGHSLGLVVTAEGVETAEILESLTSYRCDTVQGFLLAQPVAANDLAAAIADSEVVLRANERRHSAARGGTHARARRVASRP